MGASWKRHLGRNPPLVPLAYSTSLTSMRFYDVGCDGALVPSSTTRGDLVTLEEPAGR